MFKKVFSLVFCCLSTAIFFKASAQDFKLSSLPSQYQKPVKNALKAAGMNRNELEKVLEKLPKEMREGAAFLIAYMPKNDLTTIKSDHLIHNIEKAYQAKSTFSWAKEIPDSIFLNEVLPYRVFSEDLDDWRGDFYDRFSKYVTNSKTIKDAVVAINKNMRDEVKVDYNTQRKKADQNPSESISQGMASCTGLSILLIDALRSVGIPARIAGTPNWHDNRGNHSWVEVWINGKWYFTEYYPDKDLNYSWFLADAGKADPNSKEHSIYAASYKPAATSFPAWSETEVYADNVSQRYIDLFNQQYSQQLNDKSYTRLNVTMYLSNDQCQPEGRTKCNVDIFQGNDQIGGGSTATKLQDANDYLTFIVKKNQSYTLRYSNKNGPTEKKVTVKDEPLNVILYFN